MVGSFALRPFPSYPDPVPSLLSLLLKKPCRSTGWRDQVPTDGHRIGITPRCPPVSPLVSVASRVQASLKGATGPRPVGVSLLSMSLGNYEMMLRSLRYVLFPCSDMCIRKGSPGTDFPARWWNG